jgi:glutamate racemase
VIHSLACPLLVPFAEEGWMDDPITDAVCRRYLNQIPFEVRTVVMACTHYPILLPSLARTRPGTTWLDSGEFAARTVDHLLQGSLGFRTASARGSLSILLTDASSRLQEVGERFLSEPLESVELVEL